MVRRMNDKIRAAIGRLIIAEEIYDFDEKDMML